MINEQGPKVPKTKIERTTQSHSIKSAKANKIADESDKAPERWISVFGFVLVKKTDVLAAAAFLLSLATVILQLTSWIVGPQPSIYSPDVVYIFFDRYANNKTLLRFAADVTFVNTASAGHDSIVRDIKITVSGKNFLNSQSWLSFVSIRRNGADLQLIPVDTAHPFPLTASSAVSYMVSFAPRDIACVLHADATGSPACNPEANFVSDTEFLNEISTISTLRLDITARLVGSAKLLLASCTIPVNIGMEEYLAENKWFAVQCIPEH